MVEMAHYHCGSISENKVNIFTYSEKMSSED